MKTQDMIKASFVDTAGHSSGFFESVTALLLGAFMLVRNKFKIGISVLLLCMLILSFFVISQIGEFQKKQLLNSRFDQLISLREALSSHVKDYQKETILAVQTLSHDREVQESLRVFSEAYAELSSAINSSDNAQELAAYYEEYYLDKVNRNIPNSPQPKPAANYVPRSPSGVALQSYYLLDQSDVLNAGYIKAHNAFHDYLKRFQQQYGFYDVFLVDTKGNVVYSVEKETDVGTNLLNGPYKDSGLAKVYRLSVESKDKPSHASFQPYEPSFNVPASFMAMPVFDRDKFIGSVVVQLSIEPINNIMTFNGELVQSGLGETGEAYIVGEDYTMRNDSRFIDKIDHPVVQDILTTIGVLEVKTDAVEKAKRGEVGTQIVTDYRDQPVLSAYAPIDLFGEKAVIAAEMDEKTVIHRIDSAVDDLLFYVLLGLFALWAFLLLFFKQLLLKPIQNLNRKLQMEVIDQEQQVIVSQSLLNEYKKAVDASALVSKTDYKGKITYINDAFCEVTGYKQEELIGCSHSLLKHPKTPKTVYQELWQAISHKKIWKGVLCNATKTGEAFYVSSTIVPILTIDGDIFEHISIATDVTELFLRQEEILLHTIDGLTDLPNRQKFLQQLSESSNPRLAILNIDRFSEINDFYGYDFGDLVLVQFARFLSQKANGKILIYRLSGDEFALLAKDDYETLAFEERCIDILDQLEKMEFKIEEHCIHISATMGAAEQNSNVYVNAGMALRVAKESKKKYLFYNSNVDTQKRTGENLRWAEAIKQAITNDKVALFIQPIVNRETDKIDRYECLMRLINEKGEEVSPFYFIDIAKYARLYIQLSEIIIRKSFAHFRNSPYSFSINLSIIDILDDGIVKLLKTQMQDPSVARRVVLEIVESEGIDNYDQVFNFIQEMKQIGCKIAIDDFGTGYSNFEYLMKLDPDYIKIDGSIIRNIAHDHGVFAVTKLIHDFSQSIGAKTIAEFVCDTEIVTQLNDIGVDYYQGYHYGKPIAA